MPRPKTSQPSEEVKTNGNFETIVRGMLDNKHVYNKYETVDYVASTGSLALDIAMDGGVHPGVTRLVGASMGGKTSESFQIMQNVFAIRPKSRGVYIKTERLSRKTKKRIGVKIVDSLEDWDNHTCLMVECNVYDVVSQFIIDLILENITRPLEQREQFVFIIDSLDFLILESDLEKTAAEAGKVAGPQVITKKLMQRVLLPLAKFGHIGLFISQITAQPKIDPYAKVEPRTAGAVSGGNAIIHAADNILEFQHRYNGDYILEKPNEKPDNVKNKTLGHRVTVIFRKSDNEKYNQKVSYPVQYGKENGESIWLEREVGDALAAYGFFKKSGSWFELADVWKKKVESEGFPTKIQGLEGIYRELSANPKALRLFYDALVQSITPDDVNEASEDDEA